MSTINQQMSNIVQTAVAAGNFTTLVRAVQTAGLGDTLSGQGPFTVFAPTDTAFKNLPIGTLDALLKDPQKLKNILTYHVIDHKMTSTEVNSMTSDGRTPNVTTVQGSPVILKTQGTFVKSTYVNDAKVLKSDIESTNGVIHVIDKVLMPTK